MAKATKKREVKTIKKVVGAPAPAPVREEPELAPDAKPIDLTECVKNKTIQPFTQYTMVCQEGVYIAESWLGLGWAIFTHRLWHLWNDGSFKD